MKLNLCPVCGSSNAYVEEDYVYYVYCQDCGTMGPEAETENGAAKKWNAADPDDVGCPFCGGKVHTRTIAETTVAVCTKCKARGPVVGSVGKKAESLAHSVFIFGTEAVEGR